MWVILAVVVMAIGILIRWRCSGQKLHDFLGFGLVYLYCRLWHRMTVNMPSLLPREGPGLLVANHTCSADPVFITIACYRPLSFLTAREYYKIPLLSWLFRYLRCIPVTRNGREIVGLRQAFRQLQEKCIIGIFPEGGLSNAGRSRMRRCKGGAAYLALKSRLPVFPVLITGGPQTSHIGRAYLEPSHVRLIFGASIDLSAYYTRPLDRALIEEVTETLIQHIEALRYGAPKFQIVARE